MQLNKSRLNKSRLKSLICNKRWFLSCILPYAYETLVRIVPHLYLFMLQRTLYFQASHCDQSLCVKVLIFIVVYTCVTNHNWMMVETQDATWKRISLTFGLIVPLCAIANIRNESSISIWKCNKKSCCSFQYDFVQWILSNILYTKQHPLLGADEVSEKQWWIVTTIHDGGDGVTLCK
jgi:hypothetical protein